MITGKLIRDKIRARNGEEIVLLGGGLHKAALIGKLHEETEEIARAQGDVVEYADVLQVLIDLANVNGIEWREITEVCVKKRDQLGGFRLGHFLQRVTK